MAMQISPLQIVQPQHMAGVVTLDHLAKLGAFEPSWLTKTMDNIYEVNNGKDNFVSWIEKGIPTKTVDGYNYRWRLQGGNERSIPLVKAEVTLGSTLTSTDKAGLNNTVFYMFFNERWFEATTVLMGKNPESYLLRVVDEPIHDGTYWRYKVALVDGNANTYVPYADLAGDTLWSDGWGQIERDFSKRGNSVHHASWMEFENTFTDIRKDIMGPGSIINAGDGLAMAFQFKDPDTGKIQTTWMEKLLWDFYVQRRQDKALAYIFGRSNKNSNGDYIGKGESGNQIYSSYGLMQQMNLGNVQRYSNFNLDRLGMYLLQLSVGKISEGNRSNFVLSTGEAGLYQFHQAASNKASRFPWLRTDSNYVEIGDNKVKLKEGQFMEYDFINGIKVKLMKDPTLDSPNVYKERDKSTGLLLASRIYNIWDFGSQDGEPNIQKVVLKGDAETMAYVPGIRHPFGKVNNSNGFTMAASQVDGWYATYMSRVSIAIKNPLRTGRYIPSEF